VYLPHFRQVVAAGVASVMSAYNAVNGDWCGHSRTLLTDVLREEWGFDGIVVSDFQFGLRDPIASLHAGLDVEMPYRQQRAQHLPEAVAEGRLDGATVDAVAARVIATLLRFARVLEATQEPSVLACDAHRALAREAARKSIVLLRNEDDLLPLDRARLRRVAVIGRLAAVPNIGDGGSSNVHPPHVVTPLEGLRAALPDADILHDDGADASRVAASADVAIVVVGYTHHDEGEYIDPAGVAHLFRLYPPMTDPEQGPRLQQALKRAAEGRGMSPGGDRRRLELSDGDEALIRTVAAANPRTVVAVMAGSAVLMESWRAAVPAILHVWYPGMEGGHALADVLVGDASPSGRLPFAVPTTAAHLPHFDPDATAITYDLWHGQWKLDRDGNPPAFPFGFGLTYTTFELGPVSVRGAGTERTVAVSVTNTGDRDGADVVQVYGAVPQSRYDRPPRRLLGFARIEVPKGETRTVEISISLHTLAVRENGAWLLERGRYELQIARHARDPSGKRLDVDLQ
jgi:beta-glucosidase